MEEQENVKQLFGLLGKNISYSFSKGYFAAKFKNENIQNSDYQNFDLKDILQVSDVFSNSIIKGLNVTIPYKESIIPFLDELSEDAKQIGAVNTIKIKDNKKIGYNTDVIGFQKSLEPLLKSHHKKAMILGTGGASKAVKFVLNQMDIDFIVVSRAPKNKEISYKEITSEIQSKYLIVINCTPLGTFPNIKQSPDILYHHLSENHILFDLIYNPSETTFLKKGKQQGAKVKNGLEMLELQAEASWNIWNS